MNAMEKVAWTQVLVSLAAALVVSALIPWLGAAATSGFSLLALVPLSALFLRRRGQRVIVDERDREIEKRAKYLSIGTSWALLLGTLIVANVWSVHSGVQTVSSALINWLIWIQFAVMVGTHGLATVVMYRGRGHAA